MLREDDTEVLVLPKALLSEGLVCSGILCLSMETYPGQTTKVSGISWTFVLVFLKSIPQKNFAVSSPLFHWSAKQQKWG